MHQTTPKSLEMIKSRLTSRDQMGAFRIRICIGFLGLFSFLAAAACGSSISGPVSAPLEVVFENPQEEIEGGLRIATPKNKWDGYGEAIDVRGDVLVIGASE
jgi:hypothetical protein